MSALKSPEIAEAEARGYRAAATHAAALIEEHGQDATPDMMVVFLTRGAELRESYAKAVGDA